MLSLTCLIYHYYWSLGNGWRNLNVTSVQWKYNSLAYSAISVAYFGGIGVWFILFYHQGVGDIVVLNLITVLIAAWMIKQGYKDILQVGHVFKLARDITCTLAAMSTMCGIVNLAQQNTPRAFINFPNAFVTALISIVSHSIYKKEELPRSTRIGVIPVSSSNRDLSATPTNGKPPLRKCESTSTNRYYSL
jgi:hypothetical protein